MELWAAAKPAALPPSCCRGNGAPAPRRTAAAGPRGLTLEEKEEEGTTVAESELEQQQGLEARPDPVLWLCIAMR